MSEGQAGARPGRQRDAGATRLAILESATRHFAEKGYERAGVREIAADAGVTAALVNRYFGSKEGLFAEVITRAFDIRTVIAEARGPALVDRLARLLVYGREDRLNDARTSLLLLLRCATEPGAAELLRELLNDNDLPILAERLGGPDAEVRAALVTAQLAGFAILEHMIQPQVLATADRERLVALLAQNLATYIASGTPGDSSVASAD